MSDTSGPVVRVLGDVVVADGRGPLPAQQATVLAMLVAAGPGRGVPRSAMIDELWPVAPDTERLAPLISRLRARLAPHLTISAGRGPAGYRLIAADPDGPDDPTAAVDAFAFADAAARAHGALAGDEPDAAGHAVRAAAGLWGGVPFAGVDAATAPPCAEAGRRWTRTARQLVRAWAVTALRTADLTTDPLAGIGLPRPDDDDAVWLLDVLGALRTGDVDAAERHLEQRRAAHGHGPATARAFGLLALHEQGVDVLRRPGPRAVPHEPPGDADRPETAAFLRDTVDGAGPDLTVAGPADDTAAVVDRLVRDARAAGVWVLVAAAGRGHRPPADDVVGPLHAAALRDLTVAAERWTDARQGPGGTAPGGAGPGSAAAGSAAAGSAAADGAAERAGLLAGLLRRAAGHAPVLVVAGEADDATTALFRAVRARLGDAAAGFVTGVHADGPVRITAGLPGPDVAGGVDERLVRALHDRDPDRVEALLDVVDDGDTLARAVLAAARGPDLEPRTAARLAEVGLRAAVDPGLRADLLLVTGSAHHELGDLAGAERRLRRVLGIAPDAERRGRALLGLGRRWSEPGQLDDELAAALAAGIADLDDDGGGTARSLRLGLQAQLAHKLTMAVVDHDGDGARFARGVALAREVLDELDRVPPDDPAALAEILLECRWALFDAAPPSELLMLAQRWEQTGAGTTVNRSEGLVALAVDRLRMGRQAGARDAVEKHRRLVRDGGGRLTAWLQDAADTVLDLWHGHFDSARARLLGPAKEMLAAFDASGAAHTGALTQTWIGQMYWLHREQGRFPDLAAQGLLTAVERSGFFPVWIAGMALVQAELGRPVEAVDQVTALLGETADLGTLPAHGWAVPTLVLLAETCAVLGDDAAAELAPVIERLHRLLLPHAGQIALAGWPTVLLGPVDRSLGLLRLAAGDPEAALAHFAAAGTAVGAAVPHRARLRFDTARALLRTGEVRRARSLLVAARGTATQLGMDSLAAAADDVLGGDPVGRSGDVPTRPTA